MADIERFTTETVQQLDQLKDVKIERANLGPCPVCGRPVIENRKGFSCWSKDDPGCGFVIWKQKSGKTLSPAIAKELMEKGRTEKQITFKGRSGRTFRAKLKLTQNEEGKWRVDFDEEWAQNAPPEQATAPADGAEPAEPSSDGTGDAANGASRPPRRRRKATAAQE
jgi:DNA topoisomerase-3